MSRRRPKWRITIASWLRRLHLALNPKARRRSEGARKSWRTRLASKEEMARQP